MDLPNFDSFSSPADDSNKKVRKPYTITKSRESWTEPEHDKFLEALHLFDRDWKKIEAFVGSKTVIQIRSHAQKYFMKVQKSGTNERLPPPRPKRKATHPYPQKASKIANTISQEISFQASGAVSDAGRIRKQDSSALPRKCNTATAIPGWTDKSIYNPGLSHKTTGSGNTGSGMSVPNMKTCGSKESTPRTRLTVLPDFSEVYNFIGSIFDPTVTGHLQRLKKMDPIDIETILLLMRNLTINLARPDFEEHRNLLATYVINTADEEVLDLLPSMASADVA